MGGGSKEQTVGYKYYIGMHMVNCHGDIDALLRIRVDEKDAWTGYIANGSIAINQPELFGGETREGGIVGIVDVVSGSQSQGQNDYLVAQLGATVPAFRGVAALILRQVYVGLNPYLKRWSSMMQRIHKKSDGTSQWYDAKAAIPGALLFDYPANPNLITETDVWEYKIVATDDMSDYSDGDPGGSGWITGNAPFANNNYYHDNYSQPVTGTYWPINTKIWMRKAIVTHQATPVSVTVYADNDSSAWIGGRVIVTGMMNEVNGLLNTYSVTTIDPYEYLVMLISDRGSVSYANAKASQISSSAYINDMNPSHIIRECLTDKSWGMGYQDSDIDDTSFTNAADTLYSEGMGLSMVWDRQTRIEDFIQEVIKHIYATLYVDRITGKFVLKLIRNDYVFASLPQLDESNISKIESYSRPSFGDLVNSLTVNYLETVSNKTASVTVQDTALIQLQGSVIGTTIQYPGFSNYSIASRAAQRDLVSLSTPLLSCSLIADRSVSNLNVGSVFKLYWPDFSDQVIAMRITSMAFGDGRSNKIKITCMEDIFTTPVTAITAPGDSEWTDPSQPPQAITIASVIEAPYIELVQNSGQSTIDAALTLNPNIGYLQVAAGRPGAAFNAEAYINASGLYLPAFLFDFAPAGLLTTSISKSDTSVTLKNYSDLDLLTVGLSAQIDNEIVKITAINSNVITIGRGLFDSVPENHAADAKFISWDYYSNSNQTQYVYNESFGVKLLAKTSQGTFPIGDAAVNTITFNNRAIRPYPPAQVKVAGSYWPTSLIDTPISLTWAHRNRVQQTGSNYLTFLDNSITSEVGVTYSIRLYNNVTSALLHTVDGVTGLSYSSFPAINESCILRIEIWSVRDGFSSLQKVSHIFIYEAIDNIVTESSYDLITESAEFIILE
jgi:hypothetical protein